jgi:cytochrome c oxidase subunit 4
VSGQGSHSGQGHGGGLGAYFVVFTALMVFTGLTLWAAYQHLGIWNTPVALGIATAKAVMVALIFMHLRSSPKLTAIVVSTSVVFLAFLILITLSDYLTRAWLPIYGK